jgi:hypothetical protein
MVDGARCDKLRQPSTKISSVVQTSVKRFDRCLILFWLRSAETAGAATDAPAAVLPAEVGAIALFAAAIRPRDHSVLSVYVLLHSRHVPVATTMI